MKLPIPPRQPFVGLALMAMIGIVAAEILPMRLSRMLSELKKRGLKCSSLVAGNDLHLAHDVVA